MKKRNSLQSGPQLDPAHSERVGRGRIAGITRGVITGILVLKALACADDTETEVYADPETIIFETLFQEADKPCNLLINGNPNTFCRDQLKPPKENLCEQIEVCLVEDEGQAVYEIDCRKLAKAAEADAGADEAAAPIQEGSHLSANDKCKAVFTPETPGFKPANYLVTIKAPVDHAIKNCFGGDHLGEITVWDGDGRIERDGNSEIKGREITNCISPD